MLRIALLVGLSATNLFCSNDPDTQVADLDQDGVVESVSLEKSSTAEEWNRDLVVRQKGREVGRFRDNSIGGFGSIDIVHGKTNGRAWILLNASGSTSDHRALIFGWDGKKLSRICEGVGNGNFKKVPGSTEKHLVLKERYDVARIYDFNEASGTLEEVSEQFPLFYQADLGAQEREFNSAEYQKDGSWIYGMQTFLPQCELAGDRNRVYHWSKKLYDTPMPGITQNKIWKTTKDMPSGKVLLGQFERKAPELIKHEWTVYKGRDRSRIPNSKAVRFWLKQWTDMDLQFYKAYFYYLDLPKDEKASFDNRIEAMEEKWKPATDKK